MLQRKLTTFDLTMIAIGSTIGSGIFLTPADIAQALPSAQWMLLVWAAGGLVALSGALTFAELAARMPEAGGVYAFLKRAYGKPLAFLYGWANLTVVTTGAIAALSLGFSYYFNYVLTEFGMGVGEVGQKLIAAAGILVVTVVNIRGVKAGGTFSNVFTMLKMLGIAMLVLTGLLFFRQSQLDLSEGLPADLGQSTWSAFAAALVGVFWSYGGWQHASFMSAETIRPERSVARAMVIGTVVITGTYLLVNLAYLRLLPLDTIAGNKQVAATAMTVAMGSAGGLLIAVAIFVSTFGTTGIFTLTAPRLYYQMAADQTFFPKIGALHPRYKTPMAAILLQSGWAIVLIILWGTFSNLVKYVVFTDWIFLTLAAGSLFLHRRKQPQSEGYRTLLYPLPPLIFVGISGWFLLNTLIGEPLQAVAGLVLLALGLGVYFGWQKWGKPGSVPENDAGHK